MLRDEDEHSGPTPRGRGASAASTEVQAIERNSNTSSLLILMNYFTGALGCIGAQVATLLFQGVRMELFARDAWRRSYAN